MYTLKMVKGKSYTAEGIKATKKNPYVTVETDAEAQALVATKHFALVSVETEADEAEETEETEADEADLEALSKLSKAKLIEYAEESGIDISAAKTKEDILALISEYYGGSSTMIDLEQ